MINKKKMSKSMAATGNPSQSLATMTVVHVAVAITLTREELQPQGSHQLPKPTEAKGTKLMILQHVNSMIP